MAIARVSWALLRSGTEGCLQPLVARSGVTLFSGAPAAAIGFRSLQASRPPIKNLEGIVP